MKHKQQTFSEILLGYRELYPLSELFNDFLSLLLIGFDEKNSQGQNSIKRILRKYNPADNDLFPQALHSFDKEFEAAAGDDAGRDLLGQFYELYLRKPQEPLLFPHRFCKHLLDLAKPHLDGENLFIDHSCSTGRLIMAYNELRADTLPIFGLEDDPLFAKIAAINMCMAGIAGEIICGTIRDDGALFFKGSYVIEPENIGVYYSQDASLSLMVGLHGKGFLSYPPTDAVTKIQVLKFSDVK